jgi:hypothetical protein
MSLAAEVVVSQKFAILGCPFYDLDEQRTLIIGTE